MDFGTPEMRVAIAEDVIRHVIPDRNVTVTTGSYVKVDSGKPCTVCAVGSLFVASLEQRGFDRFRFEGTNVAKSYKEVARISEQHESHDVVDYSLIKVGLEANFDRTQLAMIEGAFERDFIGAWANMELPDSGMDLCFAWRNVEDLSDEDHGIYEEVKAAIEWGRTLPDDHAKRLEAIMDNIIANEGELVVP